MGDIALLPWVDTIVVEPDLDPEIEVSILTAKQADLLARWKDIARELKRRAEYPMPLDLAVELDDLLNIEL